MIQFTLFDLENGEEQEVFSELKELGIDGICMGKILMEFASGMSDIQYQKDLYRFQQSIKNIRRDDRRYERLELKAARSISDAFFGLYLCQKMTSRTRKYLKKLLNTNPPQLDPAPPNTSSGPNENIGGML